MCYKHGTEQHSSHLPHSWNDTVAQRGRKGKEHAGRYGSALAPLAAKDGNTMQGGGGNGPPSLHCTDSVVPRKLIFSLAFSYSVPPPHRPLGGEKGRRRRRSGRGRGSEGERWREEKSRRSCCRGGRRRRRSFEKRDDADARVKGDKKKRSISLSFVTFSQCVK